MSPKRKKKVAPTPAAASKVVELESRLIALEGCERRAANFRRALLKVRDAEALVRVAKAELEKASEAFLRPYAPHEIVWRDAPATTGSGSSVTGDVFAAVSR